MATDKPSSASRDGVAKQIADQLEKHIDEHRRRKRHPRGNVEMSEQFAVRLLFSLRATTVSEQRTSVAVRPDIVVLAAVVLNEGFATNKSAEKLATEITRLDIALCERNTTDGN